VKQLVWLGPISVFVLAVVVLVAERVFRRQDFDDDG
jgi:hypothetical protein